MLNLFVNSYSNSDILEKEKNNSIYQGQEKVEEKQNDTTKEDQKEIGDWYIEIPSINLAAPIKETTNMDVLNISVGHFEETAIKNGNIGVAAHNRGYEKNYFENLKNVKKGEEIKYKYYDFEKEYIIDKIEIIKDTDWNYLQSTEENKITLITCIENKPSKRLCVQATEK